MLRSNKPRRSAEGKPCSNMWYHLYETRTKPRGPATEEETDVQVYGGSVDKPVGLTVEYVPSPSCVCFHVCQDFVTARVTVAG